LMLVFSIAPLQVSSMGLQPLGIQSPGQPRGADGDGYADLAIGIPGRDYGATNAAGMVGVVYGASAGLDYDTGETFDQSTSGISDSPELLDHFGQALAGGDFNGDGYVDLAIGVPDESLITTTNAGCVNVLYGSSSGYVGTNSQYLEQSLLGTNKAETGDRFGAALASGDFNRDGYDDLAVGVPGQDFLSTIEAAGIVDVLYGSSSGLTSLGWDAVYQGILYQENPEESDNFGAVLTAGDFNGDGYHDLAIGVPNEDVTVGTDTFSDAGVVQIVYGGTNGLSTDGDVLLYQGHNGLQDEPDDFDRFGRSLAAGNFNGDRYDDLAIGAPYEDIYGTDAGVVHILWSDFSGITTDVNQRWWQALIPGQANAADELFGYALAAADFNGDGHDDLAVGVPGQDVTLGSTYDQAGMIHVMNGASFTTVFTEANPVPHTGDQYGYSLAAGDIDGNGYDDLVASAPNYDYSSPTITNSGVVYTTYSDETGPDETTIQFGAINLVTGNVLLPELNDQFGYALVVLDEPHTKVRFIYMPVISR
jgi:hypothetical protein